ncbi:MAG: hypothetical protein H6822_02655 [Planctomycetaceae bacterium]|nr:hypothetical protein [Planctomycetales bacterium]MCB9921052.1 hypothetical protein [Planctomycetaceae bacterium]
MKPRLIIAESDESLAEDYGDFFWKRGFGVEVAGDGLRCLELLHQFPPHALILDHDLPWGGAEGVVAAMRDEFHLATIPVLMIADEAGPQSASLNTTPVVAWFRKPIRLDSLWSALSVEIPELITEGFLNQAESLLPATRRDIDDQMSTRGLSAR